jgi:hypothetical protein
MAAAARSLVQLAVLARQVHRFGARTSAQLGENIAEVELNGPFGGPESLGESLCSSALVPPAAAPLVTCAGTWNPLTREYADRLWFVAEPAGPLPAVN